MAIRVQIRHQLRTTLLAEERVVSHCDRGNTDIVGDLAGDPSMTNPLFDKYDNEPFCMLILGAS
jgi:hypothetical protein